MSRLLALLALLLLCAAPAAAAGPSLVVVGAGAAAWPAALAADFGADIARVETIAALATVVADPASVVIAAGADVAPLVSVSRARWPAARVVVAPPSQTADGASLDALAATIATAVTYPTYPATARRAGDGVAVAVAGPPEAARWCVVASDPGGVVCADAQPVAVPAAAGAALHAYLFDASMAYLGSATVAAPPYTRYLMEVHR